MQQTKYNEYSRYARIRYAVMAAVIIIIIGVAGYSLIEDAGFLDALYMTVITISTVGYTEVMPLSDAGRIFTIFLIIISWVTFAYAISVITSHFVEGELGVIFAHYRKKTKLKRMKNHIIVVGYGRNGKNAVDYLLAMKKPFVVIEKDHSLILDNANSEIHFMEGDATYDEVLLDAQIKQADALITTLPVDADNLFITMSARALNPDIKIVSRSASETTAKKLIKAGANEAVMPESVGGHRMAILVNQPDLVNFFEKISLVGDDETNLVEIVCDNLPEHLKDHSIYDLGIRNNTGANIIGYKTPDGQFVINPTPDTKMIANAKLFVLGTPEQIAKMKEILNLS